MATSLFMLRMPCLLLLVAHTIKAVAISEANHPTTRASNDIRTFSGTADQIINFDPHDYVPSYYWKVRVAHAGMMAAVWLIIFPLGGMIPRLRPGDTHLISFHVILQMVGFWIVVAAAGMGIWMAREIDQFSNYHPILGLILFILLCTQPVMELINHRFYHVDSRVGYLSHVHIWLGRTLLVAGVVQGGLGFLFAASFKNAVTELWPRIAYGLVAAIMWIIYMIFGVVYPEIKGQRERSALKGMDRERQEEGITQQSMQYAPSQQGNLLDEQQGHNEILYGYARRHPSQV